MAIGSDYNNNSNGNNKSSDTTYHSRFKVRSKDGKRVLSISFWSGLLVIDISDVDTNNGFKTNSLESIRLSPNKAKILANELLLLKEYMKEKKVDPNRAFGVNSGLGAEVPYIGFSSLNDDERTVVVTIGRIDNSGNIISSQTFNFNSKDYWYALEWEDITNMKVERAAYNQLELDMFIDTLDSFAKYMNGALAYSILDLARYDMMRVNRKFDSIFDKLGIEKYTPGSNKGSYGSNNFLNNLSANNRSSNSTSLDSLEDMLDD